MKKKVQGYMAAASLGVMIGLTGLVGCAGGAQEAASGEQAETADGAGETADAAAEPADASETPDTADTPDASGENADSQVSSYIELPTQPEEAGVYVEPVADLPEDFIRGVDISSVLAEEESGVVYYNEAGEEQDIFQTLAENGVNYVRVRVWNDPYDADGNSYGGGSNDTARAAEIGRRAAAYGMKLCVDYHYSDFWADPAKQMCPKAWEGMTIEDKSAALGKFTEESLSQIIGAGAQVGMVQIGNEINNGIAGETDWTKRRQLLQAGSAAVRKVSEETGSGIQIAVHFTDISDRKGTIAIAEKLKEKEIDYDIFAVSYYPFWHGTMDNLTQTLKELSGTYGKKVLVAENSYPYTVGDGDGFANSIGEANILPEYPATVQGQTNEIRDVCAAVAAAGDDALGFFYWEPAWIPVGVWEEGAADAEQVLENNRSIWEQFGSGWASSYAAAYDAKDAGVYFGGSSWDNQALFDYNGQPLESLKVFKYLQCGTIVERQIESVPVVELKVSLGGELVLPDQVQALFNDRTTETFAVAWDEKQLAAIDTSVGGEYVVTGTFAQDTGVCGTEEAGVFTPEAHISVDRFNLLANSSFEEPDTSMWEITGNGTDYQDKAADAYSGDIALHFWSNDKVEFTAEQTVTGLEPGTYEFGLFIQGGDAGNDAKMYIYADNGSEELTAETGVTGWCQWQNPVIDKITVGADGTLKVGVSVTAQAKAWGTLDDFYLYKSE